MHFRHVFIQKTLRYQAVARYRQKSTPRQMLDCHCCRQHFIFCWQCRCGFSICQACMQQNLWGMTCNYIIWQCPDCGQWNGFGNQ